jgi:hypothetical protein
MTESPVQAIETLAGLVAGMREGTGELYGCRQERKLVVPVASAAALRSELTARLPHEEWVPGRRRSAIHSVYLDTPGFGLYRRSLEPGMSSVKLRLRTYADAATPGRPDPRTFLEAKLGALSPAGARLKRKVRMALTDRELAAVLDGTGAFEPADRRKFWTQLLAFTRTHAIRPRLTVGYEREAWTDAHGFLRVTIDEGYRAAEVSPEVASPLLPTPATLPGVAIVEIKFLQAVPAWLTDALVALGLPPEGQPFSKFKTAVPLLFPTEATPA